MGCYGSGLGRFFGLSRGSLKTGAPMDYRCATCADAFTVSAEEESQRERLSPVLRRVRDQLLPPKLFLLCRHQRRFEQLAEMRRAVPCLAVLNTQSDDSRYAVHASQTKECCMSSSLVDTESFPGSFALRSSTKSAVNVFQRVFSRSPASRARPWSLFHSTNAPRYGSDGSGAARRKFRLRQELQSARSPFHVLATLLPAMRSGAHQHLQSVGREDRLLPRLLSASDDVIALVGPRAREGELP